MFFPAALALLALPLLAEASSFKGTSKTGLSIPLSKRSDGVVDITILEDSRHHTIAKIKRGFDAFESNTGKAHPLASKMKHSNNMRRNVGSEPLGFSPGMWDGSITVGTPGRTFTVQIDTGSSDLFLPDASCDTTCHGHTLYDASKSSTAQYIGDPVNITYGIGWAFVEQYTDTVTLAGYTATGQAFGSATTTNRFDVSYIPADGLLGMGYQSLSALQASPVFQSLVAQGQVSEPVFSLYMSQSPDAELFLGGVNKNHYTGSITYVPVEQPAYWQTSFDNAIVNGKTLLGNTSVIIDTGTSTIYGDTKSVKAIYDNISGSVARPDGTWTCKSVPCDADVTVSLTFGGTPFKISSETLNLGPIAGSNNCVGSISADDTLGFWILGQSFLQNVYTVFDLGNNRIGFASLSSTS